jgi:hypothetical protein
MVVKIGWAADTCTGAPGGDSEAADADAPAIKPPVVMAVTAVAKAAARARA